MRKMSLDSQRQRLTLAIRKVDLKGKVEKLQTELRTVNSEIRSNTPRRPKQP